MDALAGVLSSDERARATRLLAPDARRRSIVARAVLRRILGCYLDTRASAIRFHYGPSGKPEVAGPRRIRFNLSHSDELALYALHAQADVGVDVERVRPFDRIEALARRFFSAREHRALAALPSARQNRAFLSCWTRKEACVKASGGTLLPGLRRIEVFFGARAATQTLGLDDGTTAVAGWHLADLTPEPGYVGAVACSLPTPRISTWSWPG